MLRQELEQVTYHLCLPGFENYLICDGKTYIINGLLDSSSNSVTQSLAEDAAQLLLQRTKSFVLSTRPPLASTLLICYSTSSR